MNRDLNDVARDVFGLDELRPEQLTAMQAVASGRDVLAVMPTGAGKSAIYQVPAVLLDGITVVISPLIALQSDQIDGLERTSAPPAVAVNSRQGARDNERSWEAVAGGQARYLFLSPEQLANPDVVSRLSDSRVARIVVDEAHCISAWGHDFRPDYLRLPDAFGRLGNPPMVALTATASPMVRDEIVERLTMREPLVLATGFDRPNLQLRVERALSADGKRDAVLECAENSSGPTLLYTATRKEAEAYAEELSRRGRSAMAYHAGVKTADRDEVHRRFLAGECEIVAATSAFGMGIDKPDVRAVVHASVPDSVDTYYQQFGRGGRDGRDAVAVLFYRPEDLALARYFTGGSPDEELLARVYGALRADQPTRVKRLAEELDLDRRRVTNAVNLLQQAGGVVPGSKGFRTSGEDTAVVVERAVDIGAAAKRVEGTRVEMMRNYAETHGCRRQFLLGYFGEQLAEPCGNCDRCLDEHDDGPDVAAAGAPALAVDTPVRHRKWGPGVVMSGEADRITVLFEKYGYRSLSLEVIERTGVLETC